VIVTPWNGKPIGTPGIYSGVPMARYHGPDLCVGPSISSSGLRTIFNDSALAYWITSPYNPLRQEEEDSRAFIVGRCVHHLALGEADFKKHFIVRPEEYPDQKTGVLKKWTRAANYCVDWEFVQERAGLAIITPAELESIKGMVGIQPWQKGLTDSGLLNNAIVRAGALNGLIEHTIIAQDRETGVWLKSRPDVIPQSSAEAVDLKSTLSVEGWQMQRTLDDFRYDAQAALVSTCLEQAAGTQLTNFALAFVCKAPPHEVAIRELKPFDLEDSAKDNQAAIRTFALCMERGRWPGVGGGEDDARYLERSDRSRERAAVRREQLSRGIFG
jgi:hypothetical protein